MKRLLLLIFIFFNFSCNEYRIHQERESFKSKKYHISKIYKMDRIKKPSTN